MRSLLSLAVATLALSPGIRANPHLTDPGQLPPIDSHLRVALGEVAPDFTLPGLDGTPVKLSGFRGNKNVLLTFVPAAFTPVCSGQWPGYNALLDDFAQDDTIILGITVDNRPTLNAWVDAMGGLQFEVLSDFYPHGGVAQKYGVLRSDGTAERALFIIDKAGILRYIDVHDINKRPPMEDLFTALENLD